MGDALSQDVAIASSPRPAGLVSTVPLSPDLAMLAPSPINVCTLNRELHSYDPDKTYSFPFMYYSGEQLTSNAPNLKFALQQPEIVRQKIRTEVKAGRVAGPFDCRPISNLRVSPLGLVPNKEPGQFHLIHHLSYQNAA